MYRAFQNPSTARRLSTMAIASLLGITVIAGCGSDSSSSSNTDSSGTTASESGGGITVPTETGTPVSITADDKSDTEQFFTLDTASVAAGPTTFTFDNAGDRAHEMVILKTDTPYDQLEVTNDKVSEDDSVGEIGETEAGKTVVKTFDLAAGNYVLVCNIEKHYEQGMRAAFTVTP